MQKNERSRITAGSLEPAFNGLAVTLDATGKRPRFLGRGKCEVYLLPMALNSFQKEQVETRCPRLPGF
jgi:hypothetical protein